MQRTSRVLRVCQESTIQFTMMMLISHEQNLSRFLLRQTTASIQFLRRTAMNRSGSNKLTSIAIELGIDLRGQSC